MTCKGIRDQKFLVGFGLESLMEASLNEFVVLKICFGILERIRTIAIVYNAVLFQAIAHRSTVLLSVWRQVMHCLHTLAVLFELVYGIVGACRYGYYELKVGNEVIFPLLLLHGSYFSHLVLNF